MNNDIAIYRRHASHESSPAPKYKAIIWPAGEKHPWPIAFYKETAEEAERAAEAFIEEKRAKANALAERAQVANAAKAAKKEKTK